MISSYFVVVIYLNNNLNLPQKIEYWKMSQMSLIGFKNKALVFWSWVYNYFVFDRESRVLIHKFERKPEMNKKQD